MIDRRLVFRRRFWKQVLTAIIVATFAIAPGIGRSECPAAEPDAAITLGDVVVSMPRPSMSDGLDAAAQASVLKTVAGKYPLDRFLKNSIVAPFTLKRETIKDSGGTRVGHRVDLWFVAYGPLAAIRDKDMFAAMVEQTDSDELGAGEQVPDQVLATRGIKLPAGRGDSANQVAYYRVSAPVLDRVIVEGIVRGKTSTSDESHLASIMLEDAFRGDAEYPNQWRHAKQEASSGVDYTGFAAYAKATRLVDFTNAILVECHAVIHEPGEWFGGANLLSSKLPLVTQDAVRRFRRTLSKQTD